MTNVQISANTGTAINVPNQYLLPIKISSIIWP